MRYAASTAVSAERSRCEIERTLQRYGASGFMYGWVENKAAIEFMMQDRRVRFTLPLPDKSEDRFIKSGCRRPDSHGDHHSSGCFLERPMEQALALWEQECRQSWRALALVVKAKLEAVQSGIAIFEQEFMANIVLPGNKTAGELWLPSIAEAYKSGRVPAIGWDRK